jgi:hypothetical protein
MLKWVSLLGIGVASCIFACGCATSAGGIAAGEGTLGNSWFNKPAEKRLVAMIESGEADRLVAEGKTSKRTYTRGAGNGEVLVTEHRIQGMVYRVEVRNHINPVMDILTTNVREVSYGPFDRSLNTYNPIERTEVLRTLANSSFEGQGKVAYVAYTGSDGQFHPVREEAGDVPDWSDRGAIDLIIRTDRWPAAVLNFRGIRPAGVTRNGLEREPDGRWVEVAVGPGITPTKFFYNPDLHKLLKCIGGGQAYDLGILNAPPE